MLRALYYCHKVVGVIHQDIKPDNIMLNHNNQAVLIDFGVSCILDSPSDDCIGGNLGSILFHAPEMFEQGKKHRGEKTDIWALGVTIYYILSGVYPHRNYLNVFDFREQVLQNEIDYTPIKCMDARNLLRKILVKEPDNRASLLELANDNWVTNNS
jgi:serine/threonine protein kinase